MERRSFLRTALCGAAFFSMNRMLLGERQCGPAVPVMTPFGARPIQQCEVGIESLTFKGAYQQSSEWCWAACISMVFDYYGHAVDQQRIVRETWGSVVNMPGQPGQILHDLNRKWTDDEGEDFRCYGDMLSVNLNTAVQDLDNDHPLIIGALGHATVLTAIAWTVDLATSQWAIQQVIVRDPWPGNGGRRILSPVEWANINFAARVRVTAA